MAKKVTIEVEVDASKSRTGWIEIERSALAATARIQSTIAKGGGLSSMADALAKAEAATGKHLRGETEMVAQEAARQLSINQQKLDRIVQQEREAATALASIKNIDRNTNPALKEELLRRKAIRDTQSKIPNIVFAEESDPWRSYAGADNSAASSGGEPGRMNVASTMFISAARDAFASLASGANPMTVFLQQAPQVAQAFTMMGRSAMSAAKAVLMMPITWIIAGVVALGAALFFIVKHFTDLANVQKNLRSLMDVTRQTFQDQIDVQKVAMDVTREQIEWNKKHAASQITLATETENALKALREKAQFEQQLAAAGGASKAQLAKMDIEQARAELKLLEEASKKAQTQYDKTRQDMIAAGDAQDEFVGFGEKGRLEQGKKRLEDIKKLIEQIEAKVKTSTVRGEEIDPWTGMAKSGTGVYRARTATSSDKFDTAEHGKMSLEDAKNYYRQMEASVSELANKEREINELLKDKRDLTDKEKAQLESLTKQRDAAAESLGLKEHFLPRIARSGGGAGFSSASDSLTSVGNFLGSGQGLINSIFDKQLDEARKANMKHDIGNKHLLDISSKVGGGSGGTIEVPGS
jgi:hypothetical protein